MKKINLQVDSKHYFNNKYDSKARWISYWYQINEVIERKPRSVLEIGVGNKSVSDYLNKLGVDVKTVDFDKNLKPDVVADIRELPFKSNEFDVVLCAEVLEHLPFEEFKIALKELKRVTKKTVIVTLPHFSITNLYIGLKLIPFVPKREFNFKIDVPIKHKFSGEHYWEIGKKGSSLKQIRKEFKKSGLKLVKDFYPSENSFHHFFVLSK